MMPEGSLTEALAGRYRIEREIGSGGMATVYLAVDERHDRRVAVKVLQPELAAVIGVERFLAEIRTTANLQHPHILGLIDSGSSSGAPWYVMPFVDGESLRDRLNRERQLPVDEAVRLAREVADALAYAHERQIVHRDIKPENILLQGGHALVADFGIALAVSSAGGTRLTQTGLSLGTPAYMSPEQASGERSIDFRSDLYSLGAVLHEMLAGEPPFTGPTAQAIVARVLTSQATPLGTLRGTVPVHVEHAVLTALQKLPADRFSSAKHMAEALVTTSAHGSSVRAPARAAWSFVPWAVAGASVVMAAAATIDRDRAAPATERWHMVLPDSAPIDGRVLDAPAAPTLSHDGSLIAYTAAVDTTSVLYLARVGTNDIRPLAGTQGGYLPFFSPDDKWLGFIANRQLKKMELATGRVAVLLDGIDAWSAAWTETDQIALINHTGLVRLPASGGVPTRLKVSMEGSTLTLVSSFVSAIPGSHWVLTTDIDWRVVAVSLEDGRVQYLTTGAPADSVPRDESVLIGVWPRFVAPGYLVFWRPGAILLAARFDPRTLTLGGAPVEVQRGVRVFHAGVSWSGTWAYAPELARGNAKLADLDPAGAIQALDLPIRRYQAISVSPDGRRTSLRLMTESGASAIETFSTTGTRAGPIDRLAAGDGGTPAWDRSGRWLFADSTSGIIYRVDQADGSVDSVMISTAPDEYVRLLDAPDADTLLAIIGQADSPRLFMIPWHKPDERVDVQTGRRIVLSGLVAPGKRWLAYSTLFNDTWELMVETWPPDARRVRVLSGVGTEFAWDDSDRLYFRQDNYLSRARFSLSASGIEMSQPERLLHTDNLAQDAWQTFWPLPADRGLRLLVSGAPSTGRYLVIVRNWDQELARLLDR
jgi:serine/threonine-protein kinase